MSGRFELEGHDILSLIITAIAAGIMPPGITEEDILDAGFLTAFLENCKAHLSDSPQVAARKVYLDIQNTLMAYRKDDFMTIQREPQFSREGEANFTALLTAYNQGGNEKLREKLAEVMKSGMRSPHNEDLIGYSGGNGSQQNDAVIILASDGDLGVAAEYWYLNYTYGRIKKRGQSLRDGGNGKHYDVVSFEVRDGGSKSVYFDISRFYR